MYSDIPEQEVIDVFETKWKGSMPSKKVNAYTHMYIYIYDHYYGLNSIAS